MNRYEINRRNTIEDIKDCFMGEMLKAGIEHISVKSVCERCHISRTVFYQYFDDKYAILESVETELIDGVADINRRLPKTNLRICQVLHG